MPHTVTRREHPNGMSDGVARRVRHLRIACGEITNRIAEIDFEPYCADTLVEPRHYRMLLLAAQEEIRAVISELTQPQIPRVALRRYRVKPQQMALPFIACAVRTVSAPSPTPAPAGSTQEANA